MSKVVSLADERIYLFALEGNLKEVRKHIIGGGNVLASHPIHNGDTALHAACANGHLDVCKYLCSVGANEHHGNDKGNVPLHYAVKNGHLKIVFQLIKILIIGMFQVLIILKIVLKIVDLMM